MCDYGRRIVIGTDFETAVRAVSRAIHDGGLQVIARVDVRDVFWDRGREVGPYMLLEAWSPDHMLEAFHKNLDVGAAFATTFAIYEQADGQIAVVATEPLAPVADDEGWRQEQPVLAGIADRESDRVGVVLERLQHQFDPPASISTAA